VVGGLFSAPMGATGINRLIGGYQTARYAGGGDFLIRS